MALKCGIVGLPNVGKSTLFNALTSAKAESSNYPFCTIDPNVGIVTVPDNRMDEIAKHIPPEKIVPTTMEFVDIAGLVAGASQGEGLGNKFLANIRETDAIVHVVRCFQDDQVIHVNGSVDSIRDIDTIQTELLLADLEIIEKRTPKAVKAAKSNPSKELKMEAALLERLLPILQDGKMASALDVDTTEAHIFKSFQLLTAKPVLYVCNISEAEDPAQNEQYQKVKQRADAENNITLTICAAIEADIAELPKEEQVEFLESLNLSEPGLNRLIRSSYELLKLMTYFTAGEKEVRAWTIKANTKAPQAAGVIHGDFERGFIRAECYTCEDLFKFKSEKAVKEAGLYRSEGKDYVVKDGDILLFRFNV